MKTCTRCGQRKGISEYGNRTATWDGLSRECKSCESERDKIRYRANLEKQLARSRAYKAANAEAERARYKRYCELNKEKTAARHRKYNAENPDKVAARVSAYVAANTEAIKARAQAYRDARREELRAKGRAYYQANKAKYAARTRARQLAVACATSDFSGRWVVDFLYTTSHYLSHCTGQKWHVDHIVPITHDRVCGLHVAANLRVIPATDNLRKNNQYKTDWCVTARRPRKPRRRVRVVQVSLTFRV